MSASFDPTEYTRAPKVSFASAITLGRALVGACPKSMPAGVKKACQRLQQRCEAAEAAWANRNREEGAPVDEQSRAVDGPTDRAWVAMRDRAVAYSMLPVEQYPKAARAGELVRTLFGDGNLEFLRGTYTDQLAAMAAILRRIDEDGLAKDLDAVCGGEFLAHCRAMQPKYEAMVKGYLGRDPGMTDNLREHRRGVQAAIVTYATRVCATVDEEDPESAETARLALLAIVNSRSNAARRGGSSNGGTVPGLEGSDAPAPAAPPKAPVNG